MKDITNNLVVSVLTLALTWVIGSAVAMKWALRQKRRELELAANEEFYRLYGEFFALLKLWNFSKKYSGRNRRQVPIAHDESPPKRGEMLREACTAEGRVEALFVRLSTQRALTPKESQLLGLFRQAYQGLREHIEADAALEWGNSKHSGYAALKRLTVEFAHLVTADPPRPLRSLFSLPQQFRTPEVLVARNSLATITSNLREREWEDVIEGRTTLEALLLAKSPPIE